MSGRLTALIATLVGFTVLTALALVDVGYLGIIEPQLRSWGAAQVLLDLVILAVLACLWMVNDARRRRVPVWPFIAITLVAGSFGPLLYLVLRELRPPLHAEVSTQ